MDAGAAEISQNSSGNRWDSLGIPLGVGLCGIKKKTVLHTPLDWTY